LLHHVSLDPARMKRRCLVKGCFRPVAAVRRSVQAQPTTDRSPGRWRRPRSPAHARGAPPRPTTHSAINAVQAHREPGHREWGLRPGAPPPPCYHPWWRAMRRGAAQWPGPPALASELACAQRRTRAMGRFLPTDLAR
jgi:hypothetical protein